MGSLHPAGPDLILVDTSLPSSLAVSPEAIINNED